jgi:hypothetical protein
MHLYVVTGGVGRHAMFSSMIEDLCKLNGTEKISIMSAYPDVFKFHPRVEHSVPFNQPGFYDEFINKPDTHVHHAEPYFSDYVKGKTHLIEEWSKLFGIEKEVNVLPDIYIDDFAYEEAKRFTEDNGKFIVVQFSGGQSPIEPNLNQPHMSLGQVRDYPRHMAQDLVNEIKIKYPEYTILNYALPNEQSANLENTISIEAPFLFYVALCQLCSAFICIDSSLMHFAANRHNEKIGVVIWGSTGPKQLGYNTNINLSNTDKHPIRPLTNSLGDMFNKDGSQYMQDKNLTHVPVENIMNALEEAIKYNEKIEPEFNNMVENEERKKNVIELDPTMSQLLIGLHAQQSGLSAHIQNTINGYLQKHELEGNYVLSEDGTKLLKR